MVIPSYFCEKEIHLFDKAIITPEKSYERAKNLHEELLPAAFQSHRNSSR